MNRRIGPSSVVSAVAVVVLLFAGCGDQAPTEVQLRPDGLRVGSVAQAVVIPFHTAPRSYSAVIGKDGGDLDVGVGRIEFPAGAVAAPTRITAFVGSSQLRVTFAPHGLDFPSFARPILTLDLRGVDLLPSRLQMAYVDPSGVVLELLPTTIDANKASGSAELSHFSTYVMGAH